MIAFICKFTFVDKQPTKFLRFAEHSMTIVSDDLLEWNLVSVCNMPFGTPMRIVIGNVRN
jgi:hypothetical protein